MARTPDLQQGAGRARVVGGNWDKELRSLIAGPIEVSRCEEVAPSPVDHTLRKCPSGKQSANCFLMWNLQPGLTQSSFCPSQLWAMFLPLLDTGV